MHRPALGISKLYSLQEFHPIAQNPKFKIHFLCIQVSTNLNG